MGNRLQGHPAATGPLFDVLGGGCPGRSPIKDGQNWTEEKFYKIISTLDWLVFIPLSEFRHVA